MKTVAEERFTIVMYARNISEIRRTLETMWDLLRKDDLPTEMFTSIGCWIK